MRQGNRQKAAKGQGAGVRQRAEFEYLGEKEIWCRVCASAMSVLAGLRRIRGADLPIQVAYGGNHIRRLR